MMVSSKENFSFCVILQHWLLLLGVVAQFGAAEIILGPVDQVVELNELATFYCFGRGSTVRVFVNSMDPFPREEYEARGINITRSNNSTLGEYNSTIFVEARQANNETRISCFVDGQHFQEGTLIIAGPPLIPDVTLVQEYLTRGFVVSYLSWTTPFTWSNFPVINYTVTTYNYLNGDTTTTVKSANSTEYTYQFVSFGQECYDIDFTVIATNKVGGSPPKRIRAGHPIAPSEIGEFVTEITFSSDKTWNLMLSFLAPTICCDSYQQASYNITMYNSETEDVIIQTGSYEYNKRNESSCSQQRIVINFSSILDRNRFYLIEVTVESIGVVRTKRKKIEIFTNLNDTTTKNSIDVEQKMAAKLQIILVSTIGSTASLLFVGIIVLTIISCLRCSKRNKGLRSASTDGRSRSIILIKPNKTRKKPQTLKIEASNPIYEGPVYESTPGESIKSLLSSSSSSTPNIPLNDVSPRYHGMDFPPSLPPPRNGTRTIISQHPKLELSDDIGEVKESIKAHEAHQTGEEYMIMNGVKLIGKTGDRNGLSEDHAQTADSEESDYATLKE